MILVFKKALSKNNIKGGDCKLDHRLLFLHVISSTNYLGKINVTSKTRKTSAIYISDIGPGSFIYKEHLQVIRK